MHVPSPLETCKFFETCKLFGIGKKLGSSGSSNRSSSQTGMFLKTSTFQMTENVNSRVGGVADPPLPSEYTNPEKVIIGGRHNWRIFQTSDDVTMVTFQIAKFKDPNLLSFHLTSVHIA